MRAFASGKTSAVTSDSIREKENQISQKKEEKKALQGGLSDLKEIKKNLCLKK